MAAGSSSLADDEAILAGILGGQKFDAGEMSSSSKYDEGLDSMEHLLKRSTFATDDQAIDAVKALESIMAAAESLKTEEQADILPPSAERLSSIRGNICSAMSARGSTELNDIFDKSRKGHVEEVEVNHALRFNLEMPEENLSAADVSSLVKHLEPRGETNVRTSALLSFIGSDLKQGASSSWEPPDDPEPFPQTSSASPRRDSTERMLNDTDLIDSWRTRGSLGPFKSIPSETDAVGALRACGSPDKAERMSRMEEAARQLEEIMSSRQAVNVPPETESYASQSAGRPRDLSWQPSRYDGLKVCFGDDADDAKNPSRKFAFEDVNEGATSANPSRSFPFEDPHELASASAIASRRVGAERFDTGAGASALLFDDDDMAYSERRPGSKPHGPDGSPPSRGRQLLANISDETPPSRENFDDLFTSKGKKDGSEGPLASKGRALFFGDAADSTNESSFDALPLASARRSPGGLAEGFLDDGEAGYAASSRCGKGEDLFSRGLAGGFMDDEEASYATSPRRGKGEDLFSSLNEKSSELETSSRRGKGENFFSSLDEKSSEMDILLRAASGAPASARSPTFKDYDEGDPMSDALFPSVRGPPPTMRSPTFKDEFDADDGFSGPPPTARSTTFRDDDAAGHAVGSRFVLPTTFSDIDMLSNGQPHSPGGTGTRTTFRDDDEAGLNPGRSPGARSPTFKDDPDVGGHTYFAGARSPTFKLEDFEADDALRGPPPTMRSTSFKDDAELDHVVGSGKAKRNSLKIKPILFSSEQKAENGSNGQNSEAPRRKIFGESSMPTDPCTRADDAGTVSGPCGSPGPTIFPRSLFDESWESAMGILRQAADEEPASSSGSPRRKNDASDDRGRKETRQVSSARESPVGKSAAQCRATSAESVARLPSDRESQSSRAACQRASSAESVLRNARGDQPSRSGACHSPRDPQRGDDASSRESSLGNSADFADWHPKRAREDISHTPVTTASSPREGVCRPMSYGDQTSCSTWSPREFGRSEAGTPWENQQQASPHPSWVGPVTPGDPGARYVSSPATQIRRCLLERFASISQAWRQVFDPRWKGNISLQEFASACRSLGTLPMPVVAQFVKERCKGAQSVSLSLLDREAVLVLSKFYRTLTSKLRGGMPLSKALGVDGNRSLGREEFLAKLRDNQLVSAAEAEELFRMLCDTAHRARPAVTKRELDWLEAMSSELRAPGCRIWPGAAESTHEDHDDAAHAENARKGWGEWSGRLREREEIVTLATEKLHSAVPKHRRHSDTVVQNLNKRDGRASRAAAVHERILQAADKLHGDAQRRKERLAVLACEHEAKLPRPPKTNHDPFTYQRLIAPRAPPKSHQNPELRQAVCHSWEDPEEVVHKAATRLHEDHVARKHKHQQAREAQEARLQQEQAEIEEIHHPKGTVSLDVFDRKYEEHANRAYKLKMMVEEKAAAEEDEFRRLQNETKRHTVASPGLYVRLHHDAADRMRRLQDKQQPSQVKEEAKLNQMRRAPETPRPDISRFGRRTSEPQSPADAGRHMTEIPASPDAARPQRINEGSRRISDVKASPDAARAQRMGEVQPLDSARVRAAQAQDFRSPRMNEAQAQETPRTQRMNEGQMQDFARAQRMNDAQAQETPRTQRMTEGQAQDFTRTQRMNMNEGQAQDFARTQRMNEGQAQDFARAQRMHQGQAQDSARTQRMNEGHAQDSARTQRMNGGQAPDSARRASQRMNEVQGPSDALRDRRMNESPVPPPKKIEKKEEKARGQPREPKASEPKAKAADTMRRSAAPPSGQIDVNNISYNEMAALQEKMEKIKLDDNTAPKSARAPPSPCPGYEAPPMGHRLGQPRFSERNMDGQPAALKTQLLMSA